MLGSRSLAAWVFALLVLSTTSVRAEQYVIDRVVAVVGDQPVLLSTLRRRAAPHITEADRSATTTAERLIAHAKIFRHVLESIVEEQLALREASNRGVSVAPAEVDRALDQIASQNQLTRSQLLVAVERSAGMTEAEYRDAVGRQILEAKLLQLEAQQRDLFVREEELRALHAQRQREDPDATPPFEEAREELAAQLRVERMQQLRKQWMARLRAQTYVELRWSP